MPQPSRLIAPDHNASGDKQGREDERAVAREAFSHGARGALFVAATAVSLLFIGWLLFYFVLFMRRGYVG